jgi:cation transport ATPase
MVQPALCSKAPVQRIVDKAAMVFLPLVSAHCPVDVSGMLARRCAMPTCHMPS